MEERCHFSCEVQMSSAARERISYRVLGLVYSRDFMTNQIMNHACKTWSVGKNAVFLHTLLQNGIKNAILTIVFKGEIWNILIGIQLESTQVLIWYNVHRYSDFFTTSYNVLYVYTSQCTGTYTSSGCFFALKIMFFWTSWN